MKFFPWQEAPTACVRTITRRSPSWLQITVLALALPLAGCDALDKLKSMLGIGISMEQQTIAALDGAIDALQDQSKDWQQVLKDTEAKLAADVQSTIRNEIQNLLSRTVAQAGVELRCDADFIHQRIQEDLIRIKAEFLHQPVPPKRPWYCSAVPEVVDRSAVPQQVRQLSFYGYNFDAATDLSVRLENVDGSSRDVTAALDRPTSYAMTLLFGATGVQLDDRSRRFVIQWGGRPVHSIAVFQPQAPPKICESKVIKVFEEQETRIWGPFAPPKAGRGDNEFNGNGPRVIVRVTLALTPQRLSATVYMDAKETRPDWTEAMGTKEFVLKEAERGWQFNEVKGPTRSELQWLDTGGSKFDPPVATQINMGPGDLVQQYAVIGDTKGDDIGKTSVSLRFNPILLTATQISDCVPGHAVLKLEAMEKTLGTMLVSPAARAALVFPAEEDAARLRATLPTHRPPVPGK